MPKKVFVITLSLQQDVKCTLGFQNRTGYEDSIFTQ